MNNVNLNYISNSLRNESALKLVGKLHNKTTNEIKQKLKSNTLILPPNTHPIGKTFRSGGSRVYELVNLKPGGNIKNPNNFDHTKRFVIKVTPIKLNHQSNFNHQNVRLTSELMAGISNNVSSFGTRIYLKGILRPAPNSNIAYFILIMDHVLMGRKNLNFTTINRFGTSIKNFNRKKLHEKLMKSLNKMYSKPTFHGDLHPGNIIVIYNPITFEIIDVKIIDYEYSIRLNSVPITGNLKTRIRNSHKMIFDNYKNNKNKIPLPGMMRHLTPNYKISTNKFYMDKVPMYSVSYPLSKNTTTKTSGPKSNIDLLRLLHNDFSNL